MLTPSHLRCPGASDRIACPPGSYQSEAKQTKCVQCPDHQDTDGLEGQTSCNCKSTFTEVTDPTTGTIECLCAPGFTIEGGRCVPCSQGFYKSATSNDSCRKCNTADHGEGMYAPPPPSPLFTSA
jgi:hypothetical protein